MNTKSVIKLASLCDNAVVEEVVLTTDGPIRVGDLVYTVDYPGTPSAVLGIGIVTESSHAGFKVSGEWRTYLCAFTDAQRALEFFQKTVASGLSLSIDSAQQELSNSEAVLSARIKAREALNSVLSSKETQS